MPGEKFISRNPVSGEEQENRALQSSTGASDSGRVVALNDDGVIDPTMMPPSSSAPLVVSQANPNLTEPGMWVEMNADGSVKTFWIENGLP